MIQSKLETDAMLFRAFMASGQISMWKISGGQTLHIKLLDLQFDMAVQSDNLALPETL